MTLYQEIIFLQSFFKGIWVVENVVSYYTPLIPCQKIGRHQIWSNLKIPKIQLPPNEIGSMNKGWNTACKKPIFERNMCNPNLGLHIFNLAKGKKTRDEYQPNTLFS